MTLELARFTEKYCISTVFGNDLIPRLSPHSIERLIASMVYNIYLYLLSIFIIYLYIYSLGH